MTMKLEFNSVNWNRPDDEYTMEIWMQNIMQFWFSREISILDDKLAWDELTDEQRLAYSQVLVGLTGLDTKQMSSGMTAINLLTESDQRKSVISFMGAMEGVHAESYSSIFNTLLSPERIDELHAWGKQQPNLQYKVKRIGEYYAKGLYAAVTETVTPRIHFMTLAASVLLESYLFYSGFFYPLYLAGKSTMTASGEIIDLILRDESIHGLYIGVLAQEVFVTIPEEEQEEVLAEFNQLFSDLHKNELEYTRFVYDPINLTDEVIKYVEYNADKAHRLLGISPPFDVDDSEVNPIIINGISTMTKHHDFFSKKGNGYMIPVNVIRLTDKDMKLDVPRHFDDVTDMDLAKKVAG